MVAHSDHMYDFLLETYSTEILKTTGIWSAFPEAAMDYRPHLRSRSVIEQMTHQVESEARWMSTMLGIDTGPPNPQVRNLQAYIEKYRADANNRLEQVRRKPEEWWREMTKFFDVERSRAWVLARRINHSTHHRGQLVVYLRLLDLPQPSVYGPTADTDGRVIYRFEESS